MTLHRLKKLGMKTVCVKQGIHKLNTPKNEFEVPDYTVDTIEELLNILKRDTKLKFSVPL